MKSGVDVKSQQKGHSQQNWSTGGMNLQKRISPSLSLSQMGIGARKGVNPKLSYFTPDCHIWAVAKL